MAKTKSTLRRNQELRPRDWRGFSKDEIVAAVCKYLTQGYSPAEIVDLVLDNFRVKLTREDPYRLISYAAQNGWLQVTAPTDPELEEKLRKKFSWLEKVVVVRTSVADDISYHVAVLLKEIMLQIQYKPNSPRDFHLGLSGGNTLRKASRHFAAMLKEPMPNLPDRIILHAMVGGFTYREDFLPTDANSFFSYFAGEPRLKVKTSFQGLHAPGMVPEDMIAELRSLHYIRRAYERVNEIQVILTSAGGHWRREHSIMYDMYKKSSPQTLAMLARHGVIGDMMWRPINSAGPVEVPTEMRAMTLVELSDLPGMIRDGAKKVILHLGPCGNCGGDKKEVLRAILGYKKPLITHLVADSRSVRGLFA